MGMYTFGEYIAENPNTTDNLVDNIKKQESIYLDTPLPTPFMLKKIGIISDKECTVKINNRPFVIKNNETAIEIGANMVDIISIIPQDNDVKLTIRYFY